MKEQKLDDIKACYPDEYLLVEVTGEEKGVPIKGILRAHGKERKRVLRKMSLCSEQQVYFFYNGLPVAPDTVYVL